MRNARQKPPSTSAAYRIDGRFVIARNTAFTYKGKPADIGQIGCDLGVRYLLQGGVRRLATTFGRTSSYSMPKLARISDKKEPRAARGSSPFAGEMIQRCGLLLLLLYPPAVEGCPVDVVLDPAWPDLLWRAANVS